MARKKRVAVVGSGIAGLSTLYTLRNSGHDVHLFEADDRIGGHINTATWTAPDGQTTPVDAGFIVLNTATYRTYDVKSYGDETGIVRAALIGTANFLAFLAALQVETQPSTMTFGISRDGGAFEWAGTSLRGVFSQRRNALRPRFWRMLFDIVRFNQCAVDLLAPAAAAPGGHGHGGDAALSIGAYLAREGYSAAFRDDYLVPLAACVWSTGPDKCALLFPAATLARFMWNHHLLSTLAGRPPWLTVAGGARTYVDAVLRACLHATVHTRSPVVELRRSGASVVLGIGGNRPGGAETRYETFDDVVLACHGDQALHILGAGATADERAVLSAFETTPNTAFLHSDTSARPSLVFALCPLLPTCP